MKRYIKDNITQTANRIVIVKDGMQYINPTEDMILADGWKEYNEHETVEISAGKLLEIERQNKINEVELYDLSPNVNAFLYNGVEMWLDKATRVGLKLRFETEIEDCKTETILWYAGEPYKLDLTIAMKMLKALESYASACYDNTQYHIAAIKKLTTTEDVRAYDYRVGYPDKVNFQL